MDKRLLNDGTLAKISKSYIIKAMVDFIPIITSIYMLYLAFIEYDSSIYLYLGTSLIFLTLAFIYIVIISNYIKFYNDMEQERAHLIRGNMALKENATYNLEFNKSRTPKRMVVIATILTILSAMNIVNEVKNEIVNIMNGSRLEFAIPSIIIGIISGGLIVYLSILSIIFFNYKVKDENTIKDINNRLLKRSNKKIEYYNKNKLKILNSCIIGLRLAVVMLILESIVSIIDIIMMMIMGVGYDAILIMDLIFRILNPVVAYFLFNYQIRFLMGEEICDSLIISIKDELNK